MIQATSITKSFGPVKVLKGIDFQAEDREVISIVGASGAGKSTLLQILGSLSRPDTGKVIIDGTDIFSLSSDQASELLSSLGLGHRLEHKPAELSGGEQQRVAIARAVINRPSVILADEPSGNLDSNTKKDIHQLFFDLRDRFGQTVIIVTHDRDLASMSDRMLEMKDGLFFN